MTNYLMVCTILFISLLGVFFAEKIQVGGGLGWDGMHYGDIAANFEERITHQQLSDYRIQRIVPSGIIYGVFRLFEIPLSVPNIIRGFEFLNVLLFAISAWFWGLIADELKISTKGKWLGFTALFINFGLLKLYTYYPVLTDTMAFTLGTLMLFAYLKDRPFELLILAFIGAFTWPTLLYCGILLIIFPRKTASSSVTVTHSHRYDSYLSINWPVYLSVLVAGVAAVMLTSVYYIFPHFFVHYAGRAGGETPIFLVFVNLSICVVGIYVFLMTKPLFFSMMANRFDFTYFKTIKWLMRVMACLLLFVIVKFIIAHLSSPVRSPLDTLRFLKSILAYGIDKPFIFGLAHIIYYGPIVFIMAFFLKHISNCVVQHGLGISVLWLMGIFLTLKSESRQFINLFPIFAIFTVKVLDELQFGKKFYITFFIASLLFSRVYITINTGLESGLPRWLFGAIGPWMTDEMYLVQSVFVAFMVFFFYFEFFRKPRFIDNLKQK